MLETTAKLTAAMAAGREEAVEVFYRRYFDKLYASARRATRRDEAFCLDVVQEAVLRIIRTVRKVESENQFNAWLALVVRTTAYDQIRRETRRKKREVLVAAQRSEVGEKPLEPHEEQLQWLAEKIGRMDPRIAQMLQMRMERGWALRKIAEALGASVGSIDGQLRRALQRLKADATERFDNDER